MPRVEHPLVDEVLDDALVSRSDEEVLALTGLRGELLLLAAASGKHVVLKGPATQLLTGPMHRALGVAGGRWLVRDADGAFVEALARPDGAAGSADVRDAFALHLLVSASIRHRPDGPVAAGLLVEQLSRELYGDAPASWGLQEPLVRPWSVSELSVHLRGRLGRPVLIGGSPEAPLDGTVVLRGTDRGFEEIVLVRLAVDSRDSALELAEAAVHESFSDLAGRLPLFALALLQPGRRDLLIPSRKPYAPAPLAVLLGPPATRDLAVDAARLASFNAVALGRPRVPSLLVPFTGELSAWSRVDDLIDSLGRERVKEALRQGREALEKDWQS